MSSIDILQFLVEFGC